MAGLNHNQVAHRRLTQVLWCFQNWPRCLPFPTEYHLHPRYGTLWDLKRHYCVIAHI